MTDDPFHDCDSRESLADKLEIILRTGFTFEPPTPDAMGLVWEIDSFRNITENIYDNPAHAVRTYHQARLCAMQLGIEPPEASPDCYKALSDLLEACRATQGKPPARAIMREKEPQGQNMPKPTMNIPKKQKPSPAEQRAWQSYSWVCEKYPHLISEDGTKTKDMYEAALESPAYCDDDGNLITEIGYATWTRYLRGYIEKAPSREDTRPTIRDEEIASFDNIDKLGSVKGSYSTDD